MINYCLRKNKWQWRLIKIKTSINTQIRQIKYVCINKQSRTQISFDEIGVLIRSYTMKISMFSAVFRDFTTKCFDLFKNKSLLIF